MTRISGRNIAGCAAALMLCACTASQTQTPAQVSGKPVPADRPTTSQPAPPASILSQAKRAPGQENQPLIAYRAFGTEPFWNVRSEGDTLLFTTPEDQAGQRMRGTHTMDGGGIRYVGDHANNPFELDIRPGECSDGMSDNVYRLTATFRYGETTYAGCAEQAMAK